MRTWSAISCLSCVFLLAACAPLAPVKHHNAPVVRFGEQVDELAATARELLVTMNQTLVEAELVGHATADKAQWQRLSLQDLRQIDVALQERMADSGAIEILTGLQRYAAALAALAEYDGADAAQRDAQVLYQAWMRLRSIAGAQLPTAEPGAGVAALSAAVGGGLAEGHKNRALHDIVRAADPAVQQLVQRLATELAGDGAYAAWFRTAGVTVLAERFLDDKLTYANKSLDKKIELLNRYRQRQAVLDDSARELGRIAASARSVARAHAELVEVLSSHAMAPEELLAMLEQLQVEAERIRAFRQELIAVGDGQGRD